ncbi:hypothetical protein BJF86_09005 [Serinicoccus sp. CNJ-927]|uniref:hypothetical protein n=1 Tax=Serinicoccus sp. CNJ-927 TaxID=1904970 RepID=UPI00095BF8AC|nr:hypothetical protein [Serinicoccus sp. CNJ-927]OLT39161.1 hypothetical protein BJF86_09005 [Serinicoccus sp. CNJ-927]
MSGPAKTVSFTPAVNTAPLRVMAKIGLVHDPARDVDHPRVGATAYPRLVRHLFHATGEFGQAHVVLAGMPLAQLVQVRAERAQLGGGIRDRGPRTRGRRGRPLRAWPRSSPASASRTLPVLM